MIVSLGRKTADALESVSATKTDSRKVNTDLQELARVLLETMVNTIMNAQTDAPYEAKADVRDGYRERGLVTAVGTNAMRIPKLCVGTYFPEGDHRALLPRGPGGSGGRGSDVLKRHTHQESAEGLREDRSIGPGRRPVRRNLPFA
ncbi:MAG: transposase [Coriobacteriaceae bacterium]